MNAYTILYALNGVRGGYIQEAAPAPEGIRRLRRPLRILLAASAIAALLLGTALALSPGLRAALGDALGSFLPYARPVEEEGVTDQGIRIKPVAALSDGNAVQVYFAVTDLTGDRLDENTVIEAMAPERPSQQWTAISWGNPYTVSYDPQTRTGLFRCSISGDGLPQEAFNLRMTCTQIRPGSFWEHIAIDPAWITADALETQWAGGRQVLTPDQTPRALESDLVSLSSFGFGTDGMLHIQLRLRTDVAEAQWDSSSIHYSIGGRTGQSTFQARDQDAAATHFTVDGATYWDLRTGLAWEDWQDAVFSEEGLSLRLQTQPPISGTWIVELPVTAVEKTVIDMGPSGTVLNGIEAEQMYLSPISCVLESNRHGYSGGIGYDLTLYMDNGQTLTAKASLNTAYLEDRAVNHWSFPEPVEVEAITGVAFGQ